MMGSRSLLRLAVGPCVLLLCAACASTTIKSNEKDGVFLGAAASYEVYPGLAERRSGSVLDLVLGTTRQAPTGGEDASSPAARSVRPTIALDASFVYGEKSDRQRLDLGDEIDYDGVVFPGPQEIDLDYELSHSRVVARGGVRFWDILSIEPILGLGIVDLELALHGSGRQSRDDHVSLGPNFGARATVRPIPMLDLFGEWSLTVNTDTSMSDAVVGAAVNLTRNVAVSAGYRWWHYERQFSGESDVDIQLSGASIGLALGF